MVDSGYGQSESVIDLTTRRKRIGFASPVDPGQAAPVWEGTPDDLLEMPFLINRLSAENEQVRLWAAFQLVGRWEKSCEEFLGHLWNSSQEEIRESAVSLIGKHHLQTFAFPLMREFRSGEQPLRFASGIALGRLRYEPAEKLLERWFLEAMSNPDTNALEVESAAESLLFYDNATYWDQVYNWLGPCEQNHSFYSTLFGQLALHAESPSQIEQLMESYGKVRESFNDFHLTEHLVDLLGRGNVSRYFQARLNGGYPLNAIYQECLKVLGWDRNEPEIREAVNQLAGCGNTHDGVERFLELSEVLLKYLVIPGKDKGAAATSPAAGDALEAVRAFLRGCRTWLADWEGAILKVRELEYHLIVSLPLVSLLQQVESQCLADPQGEAVRIMRIYQSPLLSPRFMGNVLDLLGRNGRQSAVPEFDSASYPGWVRDEEKDALWKLYTGQLEGVDYPLEQVLPQPWEYPLGDAMPRLVAWLKDRFTNYLETGRSQAVDYCLEIFRRAGDTTMAEHLLGSFEPLINHHFHSFVELMTHLPDLRFLQPLVDHYRAGENDMLRLIRFICDVHGRPHPDLGEAAENTQERNWAGTARLLCRDCGAAYEYRPERVYVHEGRIEQRQIPAARDVWTPTRFECKKCGAPVPFDPDDAFLQELFGELLAARLFPAPPDEELAAKNIHPIEFPEFDGKALNPIHFFTEVERLVERGNDPARELDALLEKGRFEMEIGMMDEAKQTLKRIAAGPNKCPQAFYYLGVIAFQEKNLYEARVYFSRLIQSCSREDFGDNLDNPVDMAHHYLKLLEKREFKRSQFHLISS